MTLTDVHCHLQDPRLGDPLGLERLLAPCRAAGIQRWMVNATRESDWNAATQIGELIPGCALSFGLHPWWQKERSAHWLEALEEILLAHPLAAIGETGLDRWIEGHDLADQLRVLKAHLQLSRELNRPITLHCLKAWPELLRAVRECPPAARGFLLHSYAAPPEMLAHWIAAGAYFSFSPAFLHPRKEAVRRMFAQVPLERLLLETDAPDMAPPPELALLQLPSLSESAQAVSDRHAPALLNHPLNLRLCLSALAVDRALSEEALAAALEANANRLFSWPT